MSTKTTRHLGAVIFLTAANFATSSSDGQAPPPVAPPGTETQATPATPQPPPPIQAVPLPPGAPVLSQPRAVAPAGPVYPAPVAAPRMPYYELPATTLGRPDFAPAPGGSPYYDPRHANRSLAPTPEAAFVPRGEQIIRDAKLKVLEHHYETALSEVMEIRRSLLTAPSDQREALEAKAKALQGFTEKLEADIKKLGREVQPASAAQPRNLRLLKRSVGDTGPARGNYTPAQAAGAPDSGDSGGDSPLAWCMESATSESDHLDLFYDHTVEVAEVRIHETYATGALAVVTANWVDDGGQWQSQQVIWAGDEPVEKTPAVRVLTALPGIKANRIRLEFQTTRIKSWQEIDAVELVGRDGSHQWASNAEASSFWGHARTSSSSERESRLGNLLGGPEGATVPPLGGPGGGVLRPPGGLDAPAEVGSSAGAEPAARGR